MTYEQKLTKIGNSVGVIIPSEVLKRLKLTSGSKVFLEQVQDQILVKKTENTYVSPEFLRAAEKVSDKYKKAFRELAIK